MTTFRLHEACCRALGLPPAPMPHESATTAPRALGFSALPFHDPSHAPLQPVAESTPPDLRFQAWRNPSSQMMCRRCAVLPTADDSRWLSLLLSARVTQRL